MPSPDNTLQFLLVNETIDTANAKKMGQKKYILTNQHAKKDNIYGFYTNKYFLAGAALPNLAPPQIGLQPPSSPYGTIETDMEVKEDYSRVYKAMSESQYLKVFLLMLQSQVNKGFFSKA